MRLMRPGTCVGPQQHYLYENQLTYVRWAAVDAYKAELAPTPFATLPASTKTPLKRPLTPPTEAALERERTVSRHSTPVASTSAAPYEIPHTPKAQIPAPRTPTRTNGAVPGQPRKTPGKTKHSVASPEVRDLDAEEEGFVANEELMLIKDPSTEEDDEDDPLTLKPTPASPVKPSRTTAGAVKSSTRPTRIAHAKRPLSAIADNRMVDLGYASASTSSTSNVRPATSRAVGGGVKNLATLFESGGAPSGGYNLRGGRTSPLPPPTLPPPASPSRLPTRVAGGGGRKRAAAGEGFVEVGNGGLGRSVRKRRSSLGSTDFVARTG